MRLTDLVHFLGTLICYCISPYENLVYYSKCQKLVCLLYHLIIIVPPCVKQRSHLRKIWLPVWGREPPGSTPQRDRDAYAYNSYKGMRRGNKMEEEIEAHGHSAS